jgi:hypothetical protein
MTRLLANVLVLGSWRFMGDQAGHDMFVGASCQICADSAFSGVVKSSTFDSL